MHEVGNVIVMLIMIFLDTLDTTAFCTKSVNDKREDVYKRQLATGTIIYRSGGKFYLLEDKKMGNGSMMFSDMQSWTGDRLSVGTR